MHQITINDHFKNIASEWDFWQKRNWYYHSELQALIKGMIPSNSLVLEIGCGTGNLLAKTQPYQGVGLNFSNELTREARKRYPKFTFLNTRIDNIEFSQVIAPEYIILNNMLDYVYDIWDVFKKINNQIQDNSLIIITTNNPLWASTLRLGSRLKLRTPNSPRNFVSNLNIKNILELQGLDVVESGTFLPIPKKIPFISKIINALIPEIPFLSFLGSVQYVAARYRKKRPPLSCSVVIPCHNEEENIRNTIREIENIGNVFTEIIVVDDGSTDSTRSIVQNIKSNDDRVRLIALDKNKGKANAVFAGFKSAKGDVLIILDADATVEPRELDKFFEPIQNGTADFINGTRLVYPMEKKSMRVLNFIGNKLFSFLVSIVLRQKVTDTLCGTKVMLKKDFLRISLKSLDKWGDFTLLFGAAKLRLRIREIPVRYRKRLAGYSKMKSFIEVWRFLFTCFQRYAELRFPQKVTT